MYVREYELNLSSFNILCNKLLLKHFFYFYTAPLVVEFTKNPAHIQIYNINDEIGKVTEKTQEKLVGKSEKPINFWKVQG